MLSEQSTTHVCHTHTGPIDLLFFVYLSHPVSTCGCVYSLTCFSVHVQSFSPAQASYLSLLISLLLRPTIPTYLPTHGLLPTVAANHTYLPTHGLLPTACLPNWSRIPLCSCLTAFLFPCSRKLSAAFFCRFASLCLCVLSSVSICYPLSLFAFLCICLLSSVSVCFPLYPFAFPLSLFAFLCIQGRDLGDWGKRSPQNLRWGDGPCIGPQYLEK